MDSDLLYLVKGDEYIFASENCAIDILGGEVIRDVEPGDNSSQRWRTKIIFLFRKL